VHAFDLDILDETLVKEIVSLIKHELGPTPLVRIGRPPKTLLVYRADQPFHKLQTPELFFPDGSKAKVELLADGQQFVASGVHPDTGEPYRWVGAAPTDFPRRRLPTVTQERARALIGKAAQILRAAGAAEKDKSEPDRPKRNGFAGNFFSEVNSAALPGVAAWAPLLFPKARFEPGTGAWRVSSKDLGRYLEEDISIHPDGICDFGEERRLSAIDLVIRYGGSASTPLDAALWLCEQLRIDPESLGYRGPVPAPAEPKLEPQPGPEVEPTNWAEPQPAEEPWPEIEAEAFHGLAGEITFALTPLTEADPIAILAQLLAAFGSAFGRSAYYRVGDTQHFANLFTIIAGQTAKSRKGTSYNPVEQILRLADETWATRCVHSGLSSGEGIIHVVHDGIYVNERVSAGKGQPPTYERVLKEPAIADKRLLVMEQELAAAFSVMRREGNTLQSVLRLAWDSRKLQTLVKHNAESATGAHISVIGHITVEELRSLLDRTTITNGLANRFLIVLAKRTNVLPFPKSLEPETAQGFAKRVKTLLTTMEWREREVIFDHEAKELWIAEYPTLSEPMPGLFGSAIARAEAQTLRLAMLYALLDRTYRIKPAHLRAALAFWRYCQASAKHILGDLLGEPVADDILRALRHAGPDGMTRSEIYNMLGRNKSSETIGAALVLLLKHNKARRLAKPTQGRGRPTEIWSAM
jgi:hypothetical protein